MQGDLKVNAEQESAEEPDEFRTAVGSDAPEDGEESFGRAPMGHSRQQPAASYGTCLYFGPAGQRCDLPAQEGGFCARHGLNPPGEASPRRGRVLAAVTAILALLWPVLSDVVQFILRWIRKHHGI